MSDLTDLYQEIILDHNKCPRNFREIPGCSCQAEGLNPLCGDEVKVYVQLDDGKLTDVAFRGQGCAISRASASMLTTKAKGRSEEEARLLSAQVREMLLGQGEEASRELGDLAALSGVRRFPARIKCALLPWRTLEAALAGGETATSE